VFAEVRATSLAVHLRDTPIHKWLTELVVT
jgi:hypothetical protein